MQWMNGRTAGQCDRTLRRAEPQRAGPRAQDETDCMPDGTWHHSYTATRGTKGAFSLTAAGDGWVPHAHASYSYKLLAHTRIASPASVGVRPSCLATTSVCWQCTTALGEMKDAAPANITSYTVARCA
jgi:hypothetical protein